MEEFVQVGNAKMTQVPIDPQALRDDWYRYMDQGTPGDDPLTVTNRTLIKSNGFVAILSICDAILHGVSWNKKARIVLDYDPQQEKMSVTTLMESDELKTPEGREPF